MTLSFLFREFHLTFFLRLFNDDELLVCWFGRIFLFPSILNDRFAQQNILGCALLLSAMYTCHRSRFLPLNAPLKVGSPFSSSRGLLQAFRRQPCADFQNHWRCVPLSLVRPPGLGNCALLTPFSSRRTSAAVGSFLHVGHCAWGVGPGPTTTPPHLFLSLWSFLYILRYGKAFLMDVRSFSQKGAQSVLRGGKPRIFLPCQLAPFLMNS